VVLVVVTAISLIAQGARDAVLNLLSMGLLLAIPVLWGHEVRRHRDRAEAERTRAEQARRMAELDREAALVAERTRMARDLHDVVAGQLSAIALQSEGR
jgi:signal transduction histidine kinase